MKKIKKKTTSQLKKLLDKTFSEYVRRKYADESGNVACYTCGLVRRWQEQQCGHFISRSYLATRFILANVRPQCIGCNVFGGGKNVQFANKLTQEDPEIVQKLYKKAQEITKYYPYAEEIERYKKLIEEL